METMKCYSIELIQAIANTRNIEHYTNKTLDEIRRRYSMQKQCNVPRASFINRDETKQIQYFSSTATERFTKDYYISKVRQRLSGSSIDNINQNISRINELKVPYEHYPDIADLFHQVMINGINIVDTYMKILEGMEGCDKIKPIVITYVTREFNAPSEFTDTISESGPNKRLRWIKSNMLIMNYMFLNDEVRMKEFPDCIVKFINTINNENSEYVTVLMSLFQHNDALVKRLVSSYPKQVSDIIRKVTVLSDDVYLSDMRKIQLTTVLDLFPN